MPQSVQGIIRQGLRYYSHFEQLANFSGGLNLRDAPTELALTETPDCMNVSFDERGGVTKRLGYTAWNASPAANLITQGYYSQVADKLLWYSRADGKLYSDPGTGVLTLRRTWTTGSRLGIVDFAGSVYAIHPVDGLYSSTDGVTWAAVVASSGSVPVGDLLAAWQNKLWVAGNPATKLRLYFCGAGDPTKWAGADGGGSNDIREKDDSAISALHGGTGFDNQTKPCLLVFKQESTYRVHDSSTGAFVTLDSKAGAASAKAVISLYGKVYAVSRRGVYATDGFSPMQPLSAKLDPQFTDAALAYGSLDNIAAGYQGDRLFFSITRNAATVNNLALEYHPLLGWFSAGTNSAACYVTYGKNQESLLAASPTVTGQIYKLNTGGTDNGAAIQSWWQTKVFEPNAGYQGRLQLCRMLGRGTFTVTVRTDFLTSGGVSTTLSSPMTGFSWGTGIWGTDAWGESSGEDYRMFQPRSVGRAFQVRVDETSSIISSAAPLLETGVGLTFGAWGLYALQLNFTPLGLS